MLASSLRAGISSETRGRGPGPRGGGARKTARLTAVTTAGSTASASAAYARSPASSLVAAVLGLEALAPGSGARRRNRS